MSFTCSDTVTSEADLNNIYFRDVNGNTYFLPTASGRYTMSNMVTSCMNTNNQANLSDMKTVSVPPNSYAYFYPNGASVTPSIQVGGVYYTSNISSESTVSPVAVFHGEKIIDFFRTDSSTYAIDCQCGIGGTSAEGCGTLYDQGLPADVCAAHSGDTPPTAVPTPTPFTPDVKRGYSAVFWVLIAITCAILVLAIVLMILMMSGVFVNKVGAKTGAGTVPAYGMPNPYNPYPPSYAPAVFSPGE